MDATNTNSPEEIGFPQRQQSAALVHSSGFDVEGLEGLDQGDTIIPRFQIVQPTSRAASDGLAAPGTFRSNLASETFEQRRIVPLTITKGRVLFEEGADQPLCKSDNGAVPSRVIERPPCETCCQRVGGRLQPVCPKAVWDRSTTPATPAACSEIYNIMALDVEASESGVPFLLAAKGTSIKPVRRLISYLALRRVSPFACQTTMKLAKTRNAKGTFYVLDFADIKPVEPADRYRDQFLALRAYDMQCTYDAEDVVNSFGADGDDEAPRAGMF